MLREITIRAVLNGWIVQVGCQTVVFDDSSKMMGEIHDYLRYPRSVMERYKEDAVNYEFFRFDEEAVAIAEEPRQVSTGHSRPCED